MDGPCEIMRVVIVTMIIMVIIIITANIYITLYAKPVPSPLFISKPVPSPLFIYILYV